MFTLIANIGQNRELGYQGDLCFHLKEDMKFFKQTTSSHPVVMGRKTWESLPKKLPNRQNIVISRHPDQIPPKHPTSVPKPPETPPNALKSPISTEKPSFSAQNPTKSPTSTPEAHFSKPASENLSTSTPDIIISDLNSFISEHEFDPEEYFIIGGAAIYRAFLPHAQKLLLTEVAASPVADTYFPAFDPSSYNHKLLQKGTENGLAYSIVAYTRK